MSTHALTPYDTGARAEPLTVRETSEDANADMRKALQAWREAEADFAAACEREEETGLEVPADAYYARDDAAVTFAEFAAEWIARRLRVSA
jgi:ferric-dicitrate binding protein FerR (iron transport regulator)